MTAFTNILNALVAVGAKPFATTMQALRDNPISIAEGDPTAPVNTAAWHPYNKVINNDANNGRIWSFSVDGAVAAVTTPDFANGWEYAILFDEVFSSGAAGAFNINLWRETGGAYGGALQVGTFSISSTLSGSGFIELPHVRKTRRTHSALTFGDQNGADSTSAAVAVQRNRWNHGTAQKILRAQLTAATGNITGGASSAIYLYRRKDSGAQ